MRIYNRPSIAELRPKGQKKKAAQVAKAVAKAKAAKTKAKGKWKQGEQLEGLVSNDESASGSLYSDDAQSVNYSIADSQALDIEEDQEEDVEGLFVEAEAGPLRTTKDNREADRFEGDWVGANKGNAEEEEEWAKAVAESILLTSVRSLITYVKVRQIATVLRTSFGKSLVVEKKQRQLSSTEATEEEIIVDRGIIEEEEEDEIEVNP
ncbi:hypothetical protein F5882DRAFT_16775 [Hyaloscypha sp. PMI_1271]|nr:hypothetical protein F5882DRAFT_16775 [Hyaloscypha sp. PMI_1271]